MKETHKSDWPFHFALPRLIASLCGNETRRAENNALEAWVVGLAIYLINYLFFVSWLIPFSGKLWSIALIALAFLIWPFWLLVLYINSLLIRLCRAGGLLRSIPTRHAQSILLGILTSAMACGLLANDCWWMRWAGMIWLAAVALDRIAALTLSPGGRSGGE